MSPAPKLTTARMEVVLAHNFGTRGTVIVPNVSWGLINHEADLLMLRPSGWVEEIEIKVSKSDLKRDLLKNRGRGHKSDDRVQKLWFAVPEGMETMPEIPEHAGILKVSVTRFNDFVVTTVRAPKLNKRAHKLTPDEQRQLLRLGMYRIWTLKGKLLAIRDKAAKEAANGLAGSQPKV